MLHTTPPPGFVPKFATVACAIEVGGRILVLKRAAHKPQGGTWGMPAGKVDPGESPEEALIREAREETGIALDVQDLESPRTWYVVWSQYSFTYTLYRADLGRLYGREFPEIRLHEGEHVRFDWLTPQEIIAMEDGMEDLDTTTAGMYGLER